MNCLNTVEIQMVADGEASAEAMAHVETCDRCRPLVDERRREMSALTDAVAAGPGMTPHVEARLRREIATGESARGATTLREMPGSGWRRAGILSIVATAAVVAVVVFVVLPRLGAPTTLSAAQVLGRSLQTLSNTTGVEKLEYNLFIAGEMPAPHRIEYLIDHDQPGRYRFSNYGPDGVLVSTIGQDPSNARRFEQIRVDDRNYFIDLDSTAAMRVSLPDVIQTLIETSITMMQASADQNLTVIDTPAGRQYVVEQPRVTPKSGAAIFQLDHARAVIDEPDFWIHEFAASGAFLNQPYSVSFTLIRRTVRHSSEVSPAEFTIVPGPDDVVLTGESAADPLSDALTTALREIGRLRGR